MDGASASRGVLVAFSDRRGGSSSPPFDSLNLAARVGDDPNDVFENRRRVAEGVGFDQRRLALARQVHGTAVLEVSPGDAGLRGTADILVARAPGPILGMLTADCAPVVLHGEGGVAVAHAGWRGLAAGVVETAFRALGGAFEAWVGPSIHACCYEVGPEVVEAFQRRGLPVAGPNRVDPGRAATAVLHRLGIERVAATAACTSCEPNYFSHRRDGVTGRQGAFAALLPPR